MSAQPATPHPMSFPSPPGDPAQCHDGICLTCSDEAVPVRIIELLPGALATVDTGAGREEVSVALVPARVGDVVLVHAKEAIAMVGAHEAGGTA